MNENNRAYQASMDLYDEIRHVAGDMNFDKVFYLINKGADIDATFNGTSILHKACYSGMPIVIERLVKQGAAINCMEWTNGHTPLHHALTNNLLSQEQKVDILKLFLDSGADANIANNHGTTSFNDAMKAIKNIDLRVEVVSKYLEHGLYVSQADSNGDLPVDIFLDTLDIRESQYFDMTAFNKAFLAITEGVTDTSDILNVKEGVRSKIDHHDLRNEPDAVEHYSGILQLIDNELEKRASDERESSINKSFGR